MRHFLPTILLVLLSAHLGYAQKKPDTGKADKRYEKLGYREAIDLYEQGKLDMAAMERMANSYRLNHDTQNAEKWYAQIVQNSDNPANHLYYAQALQSNGNLERAREHYLRYDRMMGGSGDERGSHLAGAIDRMVELRHPDRIEISNAGGINSSHLDFSPAIYQHGVVFVSTREPSGLLARVVTEKDHWTGDDFAGLYFAPQNEDGQLGSPENFSMGLNSRFHEGPLTFSKAGDQLFFTRNFTKNNAWSALKQLTKGRDELKLQIYTAEKNGDDWADATRLSLGDGKANNAHPALAANGQMLYFSSDREGGHGGMDLYGSQFSGGEWGAPVNLGPGINTAGNEVFPFSYDDGTLYFASDGWGGLGGLDVFFAEQTSEKTFGEATNMGAPFNSNKDDFGYVLNTLGTEGYFTSAREGGAGKDDIYRFSLPTPQANKQQGEAVATICVYDQATGERLEGALVTVLSEEEDGSFTGFEEDFIVKLMPTDRPDEFAISLKKRDPFDGAESSVNATYVTDAKGEFRLPLNTRSKYVLMAKMPGYQDVTYELDATKGISEHCIPMLGVSCIVLDGRVLNKQYGKVVPNALVTLVNLCTGGSMSTHADVGGHYSFCLDCGCDFVITASKAGFKDGSSIVTTTDRGCESDELGPDIGQDLLLVPDGSYTGGPLVANYKEDVPSDYPADGYRPSGHWPTERDALDEMLERGMIIELEDIYYDFDKYFIRPDAAVELEKVVEFMGRNTNIFVEMRSHTDARADDGYNRSLSQNRANAAVDYIVKQGIQRYRITAAGFGEDQLVNGCDDGVDCNEQAHQMNRRTEIRVYRK